MKNTLLKIKEKLDTLTYLASKSFGEKAVYIVTEKNVPYVTDFPAIALKDGSIGYSLAGGTMAGGGAFEGLMRVKVTAFVRLLREGDIITGNGNEKGILDVVADIKTALIGYNPDANTGSPLLIESEGESQVMEGDTLLIQTKELVFSRYVEVTF